MERKFTPGMVAAIYYADVFSYPLTKNQALEFAISSHLFISKKFNSSNYFTKYGYYFLKGREKNVLLRNKREKWSKEKLQIAQSVANYLRFIPTVYMVVVTGALAMENCDLHDDIDLLIISKRGTVWMTRFFAILLVELLGKRRRPNDAQTSNKICLNMFIDEEHLEVPKKEQDIFSAHEVAQVKILWSREKVDQKFWKENSWITKYLPNFRNQGSSIKESKKTKRQIPWTLNFDPLTLGEYMLKQVQLFYMKQRRTNEVIKDGYLRFHPNDAREWILREYKKRLAMIGLK